MPFTPTLNEKADANELRGHLKAAGEYARELRAKPDYDAAKHDADLRSAIDFINQWDPIYSILAKVEDDERKAAAAARRNEIDAKGPIAAFRESTGIDLRTAGQQFVDSDAYEEWKGEGRGSNSCLELNVAGLGSEQRALLTLGEPFTDYGEGAGLFRPVGTPIPPRPRQRRLFIRDVLLTQGTGLAAIPYIREDDPVSTELSASAVAEGSAKPEVSASWGSDVAIVRKIAAWIPTTTEVLDDAPTLRGYIDTRLEYMLNVREEQQVLDGSGTGPQIKGIRTYTETQTQTEVSGDYPATIGQAAGKVENADGMASFVATNPLDFWEAVTTRHANQFDQGHGGPAPSNVPNITWGMDPVRTRALTAGQALVGDGNAATIFTRQDVTIRVGNQHSDYFTNNKVAILAEKRIALAVWRPDQFVETTVPAGS